MTQTPPGQDVFLQSFNDPEQVAKYPEGPRRFVPGLDALHLMTRLLLSERAPVAARVLVLGAGGGAEIKALAEKHEEWRFVGVDPAAEMLRLAASVLGPLMDRVELIHGYVEDAPDSPFDAATCLLTLHFLDAAERERTLRELRRRMRPGAPLVVAQASISQDTTEVRNRWLDRYAAYPIALGADPELVAKARAAIAASPNILTPEHDEAVLRASGFSGVEMFFAAFTWRGWVAYA